MSAEQHASFLKQADRDGSGKMSYSELTKMLRGKGYVGNDAQLRVRIICVTSMLLTNVNAACHVESDKNTTLATCSNDQWIFFPYPGGKHVKLTISVHESTV